MPNPEQIIQETVEMVTESTNMKEKLDIVNESITLINNEIGITLEELQKASKSISKILRELTDPTSIPLGDESNVYAADYESISGGESISSQGDDLYFEYKALSLESYYLGRGKINDIHQDIGYSYEKLYENLGEIKQKRKEYIEKLKKLPETVLTCYPNPVEKGDKFNIDINYALVEEGVDAYKELTSLPFPNNTETDTVYFDVVEFTGFNPIEGLPTIDFEGFQRNQKRTVTNTDDLYGARLEGYNVVTQGTLAIIPINSGNASLQADYQLDLRGNTSIRVDTDGLTPGIYMVRLPIHINGKYITKKIVVQ